MTSTTNSSSNNTILAAAAVTTTVLVAGAAAMTVWTKHRRLQQPRTTLASLQGNSYSTASDVLALYPEHAAKKKLIVITGTSSGLGQYTAWLLGTSGGAHVVMGVRDPSASEVVALTEQIDAAGGSSDCLALDLSSLESVKGFAAQVQLLLATRQAKINNAGVLGLQSKTHDGYQLVWQVNCMAPALLTELLLPCLAPNGRVINVSSEMHKYCTASSIVDECPPAVTGKSSHYDYALSKACQILHAHELNLRGVRAMAVEPGLVPTKVGRYMPQWMIRLEYTLLGPFLIRSLDQGCATIVYCCLAPEQVIGSSSSDEFYFANCAPSKPKANCTSSKEAQRLRALFQSLWKDYLQLEQ